MRPGGEVNLTRPQVSSRRQAVVAARHLALMAGSSAPIDRHESVMIKIVGGTKIKPKHRLSCHCGAVVLELDLPDGIVNPRRCDCSMCRRRGAVVASVPLSGLRIVQGAESLRLYQFNTHTAKHHFCCHCGIYTHHQRRSNPGEYGYNVGCLEGVNPFALGPIPTMDGVNHPADRVG